MNKVLHIKSILGKQAIRRSLSAVLNKKIRHLAKNVINFYKEDRNTLQPTIIIRFLWVFGLIYFILFHFSPSVNSFSDIKFQFKILLRVHKNLTITYPIWNKEGLLNINYVILSRFRNVSFFPLSSILHTDQPERVDRFSFFFLVYQEV